MSRSSLMTALALLLATTTASAAKTPARVVVHEGDSLQAAIDAASPGTTIVVEPGIYHGDGATRAITITKDGIHLVGAARANQPVVLQQTGTQTHGVWVSPADSTDPADPELPPCGMLNEQLRGFTMTGFTVQGFPGFGVYLSCAEDFHIRDNIASGNLTYAIFPVRSSQGELAHNQVSGTKNDACLYVGQDESIKVHDNVATDCIIGFEIENSHHVRFVANRSMNNTAGMLIDIVGNREVNTISDNLVAHNTFENNNRANTASPDEDTSQIVPGIGVILEGADATRIEHNRFVGNGFTGMALLSPCVVDPPFCSPPIDFDPNPDQNRVVKNTFEGNASDVFYSPGGGQGNCFAGNRPAALNALGGPLPVCR
jgi:parallel beta-helix repeat protein